MGCAHWVGKQLQNCCNSLEYPGLRHLPHPNPPKNRKHRDPKRCVGSPCAVQQGHGPPWLLRSDPANLHPCGALGVLGHLPGAFCQKKPGRRQVNGDGGWESWFGRSASGPLGLCSLPVVRFKFALGTALLGRKAQAFVTKFVGCSFVPYLYSADDLSELLRSNYHGNSKRQHLSPRSQKKPGRRQVNGDGGWESWFILVCGFAPSRIHFSFTWCGSIPISNNDHECLSLPLLRVPHRRLRRRQVPPTAIAASTPGAGTKLNSPVASP